MLKMKLKNVQLKVKVGLKFDNFFHILPKFRFKQPSIV